MYNYDHVFKYQRKTRMNDGKIDIEKEEGTVPFNVRPQIQSRFNLIRIHIHFLEYGVHKLQSYTLILFQATIMTSTFWHNL